jgi:hypothetical protein
MADTTGTAAPTGRRRSRTPAAAPPPPAPATAPLSDEHRIDMLMKAADLHLQRAIALAGTEWRVTLLFWGAMLTTGLSFIAYSSTSVPPMADYIAHNDWIFFAGYLFAMIIFLFGFSINQATSIREERTQYQACQNEAAIIAGVVARAKTGGKLPNPDEPITLRSFFDSRVWVTKMVTSYAFITAIWFGSQWLAHGKTSLAGLAGAAAAINPNPFCAFFDCRFDNEVNWGDWPELGTILWVIPLLFVLFFFVRTLLRGSR